jgi:hypothetical protein
MSGEEVAVGEAIVALIERCRRERLSCSIYRYEFDDEFAVEVYPASEFKTHQTGALAEALEQAAAELLEEREMPSLPDAATVGALFEELFLLGARSSLACHVRFNYPSQGDPYCEVNAYEHVEKTKRVAHGEGPDLVSVLLEALADLRRYSPVFKPQPPDRLSPLAERLAADRS